MPLRQILHATGAIVTAYHAHSTGPGPKEKYGAQGERDTPKATLHAYNIMTSSNGVPNLANDLARLVALQQEASQTPPSTTSTFTSSTIDTQSNFTTVESPTATHTPNAHMLPSSLSTSPTGPADTLTMRSGPPAVPSCPMLQMDCFPGINLFSQDGQRWICSRTGRDLSMGNLDDFTSEESVQGLTTVGDPINEPLGDLPNSKVVHDAFEAFLQSEFRWIFPLVDPILFKETIGCAYGALAESSLANNLSAKACVFAFLSIRRLFTPHDLNNRDTAASYARHAHSLLFGLMENASLVNLQTMIMLHISQVFSGRLHSASMLHAMSCRTALLLGGQNYVEIQPPEARLTREESERQQIRMLFWICYFFDKDLALLRGHFPMLPDESCNLTIPARYKDSHAIFQSRVNIGGPICLDESIIPCFPGDLRLAILKGKIWRLLYSAEANRKSTAELFRAIRGLDDELESWRLSLPPHTRPGLTIHGGIQDAIPSKTPLTMQRICLHLEYQYLLSTIHLPCGRCLPFDQNIWQRDSYEQTGIFSSLSIAAEASRITLFFLRATVAQVASEPFWLIVHYPMSAILSLFYNVLIDPHGSRSRADLALMESALHLIRRMTPPDLTRFESTQIKAMDTFVTDLLRLGECAADMAGGGHTSILPLSKSLFASFSRVTWSPSAMEHNDRLWRTLSAHSEFSEREHEREVFDTGIDTVTGQALPPSDEKPHSTITWIRSFYDKAKGRNAKPAKLGVSWKNLSVYGAEGGVQIHENVLSQFNTPRISKEAKQNKESGHGKLILDDTHGCVKPGEMLLVLGRPGSGCTTLLNMLSNRRHGYKQIDGQVRFGSMDETEAQQYRGQIVMNTEDELFFPTLTVGQTIDFVTKMKLPGLLPESFTTPDDYQKAVKTFFLDLLGISHTHDTAVGNEFIRGVSGGERKRVSIGEALATEASVYCWDNSTRGLDANTALEWARAIRSITDILGLTTIATLYQAGNAIFNLFDKVLVLDGGKEIFYGPREVARPFLESLGFICDDGANIADFLTGVTVPTEREVRPECIQSFPRTADEIRSLYNSSDIKALVDKDLDYSMSNTAIQDTKVFRESVAARKAKSLSQNSLSNVSFGHQVLNLTVRQYQLIWGDKATLLMKHVSTLIQALLAGSLFYNAPANSHGLFIKGGALFWSILYHCLVAMAETMTTFFGRPVLAKHKEFALYHPSAFCIAQVASDIPGLLIQVTTFVVVVYWMAALKATAAAFFTHWILILSSSFCMTAFFRLCGAAFPTFDAASKVSGFVINAVAIYTGFMIPKSEIHPWFVWIYWINPLSYTYEAIAANEFHNTVIPCVGNNLVPSGQGYSDGDPGACTGVRGASPGAVNFGIIWAWAALFIGLTVICTAGWTSATGGGVHLVPREKALQNNLHRPNDEESQNNQAIPRQDPTVKGETDDSDESGASLIRNESIFTWKNLSYTVKTPSGDRKLLDNVSGWVRPGMLGALMGSSGAGKTTLMDVLVQRKTEGIITGLVLVDGHELPVSFQRSAGYCEQFDIHEPFSTVREALEFSALLRQSREIPDAEKLAYIDTVIDLLELRDLEHSLIGRPGAGLSVEQRKRVSIGVELVAKPSILIFLDEPTSGLDGQAAYNTLRFLRRLASAGQAVLCTIHQPSAQIFSQFDTLLLLTKGGKTVYFGDIGEGAATIKDYFGRYGAACPLEANPAEHMIDVVSGELSGGKDWHQIWVNSPEYKKTMATLDDLIKATSSKPPATTDDGHEFAASMVTQTKVVTKRMNMALYRNTEYVMNKIMLHVISGLFNGFSFWMIGNNVKDLQNTLFAIFNFIFVAPGVIAQLQPLFIDRRDIFEIREKKSKTYHWAPFVAGLIISEIPYLIVSGFLYFVTFYFTAGFPTDASKAGGTFFVMIMYEFLYTGIGQFIAAYAPNAIFASMVNPLLLSTMISFCGALVPYSQLESFWRYWIYYLNPFTYLMGSLMTFALFDKQIECADSEFAVFDPQPNETCSEYLSDYLQGMGSRSNLVNPDATSDCRVCQYRKGDDYLYSLNLKDFYYGWRDAAIVVIFVLSSYALVFVLMKLRTKATKKAV
ncbi:hypothetical protein NM208_g4732 [Fusarium decemcellulare]|uniref:Uncharacterized protein n=1 Tax=Fusarium decemcellulare TaxID=57161 RepID=A0ACC1SJJ6_9HYPO|nr:hypothetical protein NM208_g4732 [Fusarium decemcellulare]